MSTPLGPITLFEEERALIAIESGRAPDAESTALLREAKRQLDAYFDGELQVFDLPLAPRGSDFQISVWQELRRIPYGALKTYGEIAKLLGTASRAVGGACARNPLPIVVPCHRVVGTGDRLTGYSGGGGLDTKRALLRLEGAILVA
jgi:methylated-DNA-[protein]-cysteine S-methyltransferase